MIAEIIQLSLQILRPFILMFFRNLDKKNDLNEKFFANIAMFKESADHSVQQRKEYSRMKIEAKKFMKEAKIAADDKKKRRDML